MTVTFWPAYATPQAERRGRRTAQSVGLQLALQSAIVATVFATAAHAEDTKAEVPKQELQAKMAYCQVCHGASGQGFRGYYPIPRLAGQQPEYFENQLQAFIERRRTNNIMFNVAHVLSPAMLTSLATNFHDFDPKPLGGARKDLMAAGKKIYRRGNSGSRCSCVCVLSRSGSQRRRTISSPGRSAQRLHLQQTDELDQRTRSKSVEP